MDAGGVKFPSLQLIPTEHIGLCWRLGEEFIAKGCTGDDTTESLREACMNGEAQLWFAWSDHLEAALVTTVMDTPKGRVCLFLSFGGKDMSRWLGLLDEIETWAKKQGATITRTFGRKGWGRVLKDYRPRYYVYEKEL